MRRIKILALVAALVCAVGVIAQPQGGKRDGGKRPSAEQMVEKMTEKMDEKLSLNDSQKAKIKELMTAQMKERETKAAEARKQAAIQREAAKKERAAFDEKIMSLLSDKQKVEYMKMKEEMRDKKPGGQRGGQRPGGDKAPKE